MNQVSQEIQKKQDIRNLSREDLTQFFIQEGEKSFRANQVYDWLWKKDASTFEEMTNLSKDLQTRPCIFQYQQTLD